MSRSAESVTRLALVADEVEQEDFWTFFRTFQYAKRFLQVIPMSQSPPYRLLASVSSQLRIFVQGGKEVEQRMQKAKKEIERDDDKHPE